MITFIMLYICCAHAFQASSGVTCLALSGCAAGSNLHSDYYSFQPTTQLLPTITGTSHYQHTAALSNALDREFVNIDSLLLEAFWAPRVCPWAHKVPWLSQVGLEDKNIDFPTVFQDYAPTTLILFSFFHSRTEK